MPLQKLREKAGEIKRMTDQLDEAIRDFDDLCNEESSVILLELKTYNPGYELAKFEADMLRSRIGYRQRQVDGKKDVSDHTDMYLATRSLAELTASININIDYLERTYSKYKR